MQKILFFAALLLPALLFGQAQQIIDTPPAIRLSNSANPNPAPPLFGQSKSDSLQRTQSNVPALTYVVSASYSIVDSATAAQNRILMYQQQKVKRDTAMPIIITRDSIRQDNKIVGYFRFSSGTSSVYSPGGFLIASATNIDDQHWRIQTFSDGTKRQLFAKGFFEQDIAEYLIEQGYL